MSSTVAGPLTMSNTLAAHLVAHEQLLPSLTNPRKRFDESRLQELADSMKPPVGILEPLVVRPLPSNDGRAKHLDLARGPYYEIVAGERRWRAAKIAELPSIPIVVRDIPDEQVITLQLVENKNREDIHPLEEAEAMDRLLKINKATTPKSLAATIGMSERYVQNRLHYLRLAPEVKAAFRKDEITAGHVDLIMRLPFEEQTRAYVKGCFEDRLQFDEDLDKPRKAARVRELVSVRALNEWIAGNVRLQVAAKAPEMEFLPEVAEAVAAASVENAPKLLELIDSYYVDAKIKPAPLTRNAWVAVKKGQKCDHQTRGVVVLGDKRGQILTVCTGVGKCKVHFPHTIERPAAKGATGQRRPQATIDAEKREAAKRAREQELGRARTEAIKAALVTARKTVPNKPTPAVLKIYGFKSWRELILDRLEEITPYGPCYTGAWADAKKQLALVGVKLAEPTLAKPAAKKPAAKKAPKRKAGAKK